jgi:hypothetical protein
MYWTGLCASHRKRKLEFYELAAIDNSHAISWDIAVAYPVAHPYAYPVAHPVA